MAGRWVVFLVILGCSSKPPPSLRKDSPPLVLLPIGRTDVADARGRFREIFVAVRDARAGPDGEDPTADRLLHRMTGEGPPTGKPVHLGRARLKFRVLVVPGLLGDTVGALVKPLSRSMRQLEEHGYKTGYLKVSGRASSAYNADLLEERFEKLELDAGERVIVIGYSKGTPDMLEALVRHPVVRGKVTALVSWAGAVGGSPGADEASATMRKLFAITPLPGTKGDKGGIKSLERPVRMRWLGENEPPRSVRYFSLGSFTSRDNISACLRGVYDDLARVDPRNDSQVLFFDQVIPGSTLLGYANCDHWAMALPFLYNTPLLAATFVTKNNFPREILLEAVVRYVEEALLE